MPPGNSTEARVILLPHPGRERLRGNAALCDWPARGSGHARKFLRVRGAWVCPDGRSGTDWLEIWTEYEAPTRAEPLGPEGRDGFPRFVHHIVTRIGPASLNTDPWIFCPGFAWTTCRHKRASGVRSGDLVLFGSSIHGEWVLDTCIVVDRHIANLDHGTFDAPYRVCVEDALPGAALSPFIGVPFSTATTLFSFVPARIAAERHAPFPRPRITRLLQTLRLLSTDAPPSSRNSQALATCRPIDGLFQFWSDLLKELSAQGLCLGTSFVHPGVVGMGQPASRICRTSRCS